MPTAMIDGIEVSYVTRGAGPRKHPFPAGVAPTELLYVQEFHDPYAEARRTGAAVVTQPDVRWLRCDIKTIQLLPNVLAKQAATEKGALEAVLLLVATLPVMYFNLRRIRQEALTR